MEFWLVWYCLQCVIVVVIGCSSTFGNLTTEELSKRPGKVDNCLISSVSVAAISKAHQYPFGSLKYPLLRWSTPRMHRSAGTVTKSFCISCSSLKVRNWVVVDLSVSSSCSCDGPCNGLGNGIEIALVMAVLLHPLFLLWPSCPPWLLLLKLFYSMTSACISSVSVTGETDTGTCWFSGSVADLSLGFKAATLSVTMVRIAAACVVLSSDPETFSPWGYWTVLNITW